VENTMRRALAITVAILSLVMSGCASTIQSNVTAFHQWPTDLRDKSYVFQRTPEQENDLEYRSHENLVRAELQRLGFSEVGNERSAKLKVSMRYSMSARDVRVVQPVVSHPWYGYGAWPYYGPRWRRYGYSPFYDPFYDPFWYGPPYTEYRETSYQLYLRRLQILIAQVAGDKMLYDVTVSSEGRNGSLAAVIPYLVRSAFLDFPGPNGVPRRVELKMEKK
jgi:hypothetical protein